MVNMLLCQFAHVLRDGLHMSIHAKLLLKVTTNLFHHLSHATMSDKNQSIGFVTATLMFQL